MEQHKHEHKHKPEQDPTFAYRCPRALELCFVSLGAFVNTLLQELIEQAVLEAGSSADVDEDEMRRAENSTDLNRVHSRVNEAVEYQSNPLENMLRKRDAEIKQWREHKWSTPSGQRKAALVGGNRALVGHIASFLHTDDIATSLVFVSRTFRTACEANSALWSSLNIRNQISTTQLKTLIARAGANLRDFCLHAAKARFEKPLSMNSVLSLLASVVGERFRSLELRESGTDTDTDHETEAETEADAEREGATKGKGKGEQKSKDTAKKGDGKEESKTDGSVTKHLAALLKAAPNLSEVSPHTDLPADLIETFIKRKVRVV